ncbi:hypothetical protein Bbelb_107830 [Branchiostoma belcheri]|nr:hypothetical protein Bbelb_107830 [Branchiostoma belcheri]
MTLRTNITYIVPGTASSGSFHSTTTTEPYLILTGTHPGTELDRHGSGHQSLLDYCEGMMWSCRFVGSRLDVVLWLFCTVVAAQNPTTVTDSGRVLGFTTTVEGVTVENYLGVPYAAAPIGNLRFKPPEKVRPWEGVRYATDFGDQCMRAPRVGSQPSSTVAMSEDCLFLNVFRPRTAETEDLAVMVFIPDDGFNSDTATAYNGEWLAAVGEVIVVTVNYRLNVFGFLSTGDRTAPGNYGLLDQQAAVQWVRDNIDNFGGDPNRITLFGQSAGGASVSIPHSPQNTGLFRTEITLFGQSAGGASVSMQVLSPQNNGLFKRAICQSGVAMSPGMINLDPLASVRALCEYLNCRTQDPVDMVTVLRRDPVDMVTVLRRVSANELARAAARFTGNYTERIWTPVIDGDFLPDDPVRLLERGSVPDRQLLLGFNQDEGAYLMMEGLPGYYINNRATYNYYMNASLFHAFPTNTEGLPGYYINNRATYNYYMNASLFHAFPTNTEGAYLMMEGLPGYYINNRATYNYYTNASLFHAFPTNTEAVVEAVALEYGSWNETSADSLQQTFTTMYGDFAYIASTMQMANLYRQLRMSTYVYQFTHARRSTLPAWAGAVHGDELYFLFPTARGNNPDLMTDDEMQLVRVMMTYWANFAKSGNPNNPYNPVLPTSWPRYQGDQRFIDLTIRMSDTSAGQYIRPRRTFFWTRMMPALDSQSCSPETVDDQTTNGNAWLEEEVLLGMRRNDLIQLGVTSNGNAWLEEEVLLGMRRNDLIQLGVVGGIAILLILVFIISCVICCKVLSLSRIMRYDDSKLGLSSYA